MRSLLGFLNFLSWQVSSRCIQSTGIKIRMPTNFATTLEQNLNFKLNPWVSVVKLEQKI